MEKNKIKVETIDGDFLCVQSFDTFEGGLVDVYDNDNNYVGYFHGNLEYFSEDELIEIIKVMIDDVDDGVNDEDDDVDNGQWNFD